MENLEELKKNSYTSLARNYLSKSQVYTCNEDHIPA